MQQKPKIRKPTTPFNLKYQARLVLIITQMLATVNNKDIISNTSKNTMLCDFAESCMTSQAVSFSSTGVNPLANCFRKTYSANDNPAIATIKIKTVIHKEFKRILMAGNARDTTGINTASVKK